MYNSDIANVFGYVAGFMLLIANCFQIVTMIKNKKNEGVSLIYLILFLVISIFYTISGFFVEMMFLYIPNLICTFQQLLMVILYLHYKRTFVYHQIDV